MSSIMMLIGLLEEVFVEVNLSSLTHFQFDIISNVPIHDLLFLHHKYRILCDLNTLFNNHYNWRKHRNTTWFSRFFLIKYVEDQNNVFLNG
jgi:hypothetical protein